MSLEESKNDTESSLPQELEDYLATLDLDAKQRMLDHLQEVQRVQESKVIRNTLLQDDNPAHVSHIPPDILYEVDTIDDFPDNLNELLVQDENGNIIWKVMGRDNIRDFLQDRKDNKESANELFYRERLKELKARKKSMK